jgi:hypothetical protein
MTGTVATHSRHRLTLVWLAIGAIAVVSRSPGETHNRVDRAPGQAFASTGDVTRRVDRRDDLPNAFGRADMFGRTRDRGFVELRYMGTNSAGQTVFRRTDVDIYTNETTMSQMGFRTTAVTAHQAGNTVVASGMGAAAPPATVGALPPDTVEFALDPTQGRTITIRDHGIEVLQFNSAGIQYRLW